MSLFWQLIWCASWHPIWSTFWHPIWHSLTAPFSHKILFPQKYFANVESQTRGTICSKGVVWYFQIYILLPLPQRTLSIHCPMHWKQMEKMVQSLKNTNSQIFSLYFSEIDNIYKRNLSKSQQMVMILLLKKSYFIFPMLRPNSAVMFSSQEAHQLATISLPMFTIASNF